MSQVTITARGILFDMDGVLISSTGADERCWLRWATHHNMEGTFSLQSTHGRRAVDTLRALRPDLDPVIEQRRLEDYDAEDHSGLIILPGVEKLLASLPADRWTIVTSATTRLLEGRLQHAGLPIPKVLVPADESRMASRILSPISPVQSSSALRPPTASSLKTRLPASPQERLLDAACWQYSRPTRNRNSLVQTGSSPRSNKSLPHPPAGRRYRHCSRHLNGRFAVSHLAKKICCRFVVKG